MSHGTKSQILISFLSTLKDKPYSFLTNISPVWVQTKHWTKLLTLTDFKTVVVICEENWREVKPSVMDLNLADQHCMRAKHMNWPQSLQSTVWTLQSRTQQLHSWILQLIATQVQFCQMGGTGLQSWGHDFTVSLWEITANKSVNTDNKTVKI